MRASARFNVLELQSRKNEESFFFWLKSLQVRDSFSRKWTRWRWREWETQTLIPSRNGNQIARASTFFSGEKKQNKQNFISPTACNRSGPTVTTRRPHHASYQPACHRQFCAFFSFFLYEFNIIRQLHLSEMKWLLTARVLCLPLGIHQKSHPTNR